MEAAIVLETFLAPPALSVVPTISAITAIFIAEMILATTTDNACIPEYAPVPEISREISAPIVPKITTAPIAASIATH